MGEGRAGCRGVVGKQRGSPRAGSKQELEPRMVGGGASAVQQHERRCRRRPRLRRGRLVMGRPREGSTEPGGLGVLGSAAQGRMLAASSSMPAMAWLENERGNNGNTQERGEHEL